MEKSAKWVLASPLIIFLVLLVLFPAAYGIWMSLQDITVQSKGSQFIGLTNYAEVLQNGHFWSSLWFTARFTLATTLIELVLGFALALLFNRYFPGKRLLLSVVLLPIMIAPSLMGVMFRLMLNENIGTVHGLLSLVNIKVNLFDPHNIVPLLILLDVIQWVPFTFLILYAGLQSVDKNLYEAAAVDGASRWQIVWKIIIPVMAPIIFIAVFLRGIDAFRTFDVIYVLTNGGPGNVSTTISIFIYKTAFTEGNISIASAASIVIAVMLLFILPFFIKKLLRTE